MIHVTHSALEHFAKLLLKQPKGTQIRVFVTHPGSFYAECGVAYCSQDSVNQNDIKFYFKKIIFYIDQISAPLLKDAEIDFINDELGYQLTLKAPHVRIQNINPNSSLIDKVKYMLQEKINPRLSYHGGYVILKTITDTMYVVLLFGGGCNGCSMINLTIKQWIEKEIKKTFPELKGVIDETLHIRSNTTYSE